MVRSSVLGRGARLGKGAQKTLSARRDLIDDVTHDVVLVTVFADEVVGDRTETATAGIIRHGGNTAAKQSDMDNRVAKLKLKSRPYRSLSNIKTMKPS
jgi:hypothetical protein